MSQGAGAARGPARTSGGLASQRVTHLDGSAGAMDLKGHENQVEKSRLASQGSAEGSDRIESVFWKITQPAARGANWAEPERNRRLSQLSWGEMMVAWTGVGTVEMER